MAKIIPLTRGHVTIVDDEDYGWLRQWNWYYTTTPTGGYAARGISHDEERDGVATIVYMHRALMHAEGANLVDHKNRDKLDNRRENLRYATQSQQMANTGPHRDNHSGFKGIYFHRASGLWHAKITRHYRSHSLGYFKSAEAAAAAYDEAAKALFGNFSHTNGMANTNANTC